MTIKHHFYTNIVTQMSPMLSSFKNIFDSLFGVETIFEYLKFCDYDCVTINMVIKRFKRLDLKKPIFFLNHAHNNATYAYLNILKIRKKNINHILYLYRSTRNISFVLPLNTLSLCVTCKKWRLKIQCDKKACVQCQIKKIMKMTNNNIICDIT